MRGEAAATSDVAIDGLDDGGFGYGAIETIYIVIAAALISIEWRFMRHRERFNVLANRLEELESVNEEAEALQARREEDWR